MFTAKSAFSGFSVKDLPQAKSFYTKVLGLMVEEEEGRGLRIHLPEGGEVFVYPKENHEPASYTTLNLIVGNIDEAVDELEKLGVSFERYQGSGQDEKGIARSPDNQYGPPIAWFKDPAGNIFSLIEDSK